MKVAVLLLFTSSLNASVFPVWPCEWMLDSRIDDAFPAGAPWSTIDSIEGYCKFASSEQLHSSTVSLTQIVRKSPAVAHGYVTAIADYMVEYEHFQAVRIPTIGSAGVALLQLKPEPEQQRLDILGNRDNIVVIAELRFDGGVDAEQRKAAELLIIEAFDADTQGGYPLPDTLPTNNVP